MTIKLVRTDSDESCKIQLPLGDHIFGRGKLLECDDKRISRQHGKLNVNNDSLTITALHQNPCFFIKKDIAEKNILRQNNIITLYNGDRFGLLPDAFWYEVLFCSGVEDPINCEGNKNTEEYGFENNNGADRATSDPISCDKTKTCDFQSDDGFDNEIAELHSKSLMATATGNINPVQVSKNDSDALLDKTSCPNEVENELNVPNEPQSDCNVKNEYNIQNEPNIQENLNVQNNTNLQSESNILNDPNLQSEPNLHNEPSDLSVQNKQVMPSNNEEQNDENNSNKRSHSPDNNYVKKVKTEPVEVKTENSDDIKPGPSLNQGQGAQAANDCGANVASPNNPVLRERCMYGANCYRKNPQHLAQFSHPRDADWGAGERGVCPYGAACAKADPRHWRDHEHPAGTRPQPRPGMRVVERHGNVYFINAHAVNFYDDHLQVEDSDGDSVDIDYEF